MASPSDAPAPQSRPRPPRRRPRYWVRRVALVLLLLLPLALWRGWTFLTRDLPVPPAEEAPPVSLKAPVHLLILGVDERQGDAGRSDTMILARLAPGADRLDLIHIPRDTRVRLRSGPSKINATYAIGGPDLTAEVVAGLLEIAEPYYVTVDFQAFETAVDLLGGVDITVERDYAYEDPAQDLYIDLKAGRQRMDGETALHYVRLRYDGVTNSDIARIERQQAFLKALRARLTSPAVLRLAAGLPEALRANVETNIPARDQWRLALALLQARGDLHLGTLPGYPEDATGDWLMDPDQWNEVKRSWPAR